MEKRIWKISPGKGAKYWNTFKEENFVAIGWNQFGDLNEFEDEESVRIKFTEEFPNSNSFPQLIDFHLKMRKGDKIIAYGLKSILGVGEITSEYYFNDNDDFGYSHRHDVQWQDIPDLPLKVTGDILRFLSRNYTVFEVDDPATINLIDRLETGKRGENSYYIVITDPKRWNWSKLEEEKEVSWDENLNIQSHIEVARKDDIVLGYSSHIKKIECIAAFARDSYRGEDGSWTFNLKFMQKLKNPVSLSDIKANDILRRSKPVRMNFRATVIRLEEWEYVGFRKMILFQNQEVFGFLPAIPQISEPSITNDKYIEIQRLLEHKKQLILIGPPGTGKTHIAKDFANQFSSTAYDIIQFHPSYSYEDFIEGIRPITSEVTNEQIRYAIIPGFFKRFCKKAEDYPNETHVLIIDEINRVSLSKVLGEVLSLLEYRNEMVTLVYSENKFSIPENVYIIGTMNTADRSIALMDFALRRRFMFKELMPDYEFLGFWLLENECDPELAELIPLALESVNRNITKELDRNHQIGHTYFMINNFNFKKLVTIWKHTIVPLLDEYFYRDSSKVIEILGFETDLSESDVNWRNPDVSQIKVILEQLADIII